MARVVCDGPPLILRDADAPGDTLMRVRLGALDDNTFVDVVARALISGRARVEVALGRWTAGAIRANGVTDNDGVTSFCIPEGQDADGSTPPVPLAVAQRVWPARTLSDAAVACAQGRTDGLRDDEMEAGLTIVACVAAHLGTDAAAAAAVQAGVVRERIDALRAHYAAPAAGGGLSAVLASSLFWRTLFSDIAKTM
jgi:hypothetical protein